MFPTASQTAPQQPSIPDKTAKRVVAIGPNDANATLLEETTQSSDYLFETASSVDAIDALLDDPESVSLAVVDVPSVTDRVQRLCRRLYEHDIAVLLLPLHLSSSFEARLKRVPWLTVRQKPIGRVALHQEIRSLVGQ